MGEWILEHRARPPTLNWERKGSTSWREAAAATRQWRSDYGWLDRQQRVPRLEHAVITVEHLLGTRRKVDVGACFPAVKAAIDGLVDARVLPDDGPLYLHELRFRPPSFSGYDALVLRVVGPPASPASRP